MKNPLDPRHKKRQKTIEELFKGDFYPQKIDKTAQVILEQKEALDEKIQQAAVEFPIEKINKVDLAILRLAVFELFIEKKTPPKVVVDEAIELAKEYGSSSSFAFINGALGKLIES